MKNLLDGQAHNFMSSVGRASGCLIPDTGGSVLAESRPTTERILDEKRGIWTQNNRAAHIRDSVDHALEAGEEDGSTQQVNNVRRERAADGTMAILTSQLPLILLYELGSLNPSWHIIVLALYI